MVAGKLRHFGDPLVSKQVPASFRYATRTRRISPKQFEAVQEHPQWRKPLMLTDPYARFQTVKRLP
jgi:hypothetical protein